MRKALATLAAALAFWACVAPMAMAQDDTTPLMAGGDPAAGEALSRTCIACHGSNGNSPQAMWPNIAGQHAGYLFKQLMDFKADARTNPQMAGIMPQLNEQEMRDLAAYYSEQPHKVMGASDEELVARGREIYLGGIQSKGVAACVACHGPRGMGNAGANYPVVGGQWSQYLVAELTKFRSGDRHNDPNAAMRALASRMSDQEIRAVAEYMAGLN